MPQKDVRLLVVSDLHCGHEVGFTHPSFNPRYDDPILNAESDYRANLYKIVIDDMRKQGPFDYGVANADLIDGRGERSGGTELIETDRHEQAKMAAEALGSMPVRQNWWLTYGTPYHTGQEEDFEDTVAEKLGVDKPQSVLDISFNGVVFNFKHKVGGSQVPHGRSTAILRAKLWNQLWADRGEFPQAKYLVRSHVHYHQFAGDNDSVAIITPALQGYGSKFGSRQVDGTVDFGYMIFDIDKKGRSAWEARIFRMQYQHPVIVT